jgi:hypothetical protein
MPKRGVWRRIRLRLAESATAFFQSPRIMCILPHPALGQDFTPSPTARRAPGAWSIESRPPRAVRRLRPQGKLCRSRCLVYLKGCSCKSRCKSVSKMRNRQRPSAQQLDTRWSGWRNTNTTLPGVVLPSSRRVRSTATVPSIYQHLSDDSAPREHRGQLIVVGSILRQNPTQVRFTKTIIWSTHSRQIDPISRSAKPFSKAFNCT